MRGVTGNRFPIKNLRLISCLFHQWSEDSGSRHKTVWLTAKYCKPNSQILMSCIIGIANTLGVDEHG